MHVGAFAATLIHAPTTHTLTQHGPLHLITNRVSSRTQPLLIVIFEAPCVRNGYGGGKVINNHAKSWAVHAQLPTALATEAGRGRQFYFLHTH
jgi:hypothetical protein